MFVLRQWFSDDITYCDYEDIFASVSEQEVEDLKAALILAGYKETEYRWLDVSKLTTDLSEAIRYIAADNTLKLSQKKILAILNNSNEDSNESG